VPMLHGVYRPLLEAVASMGVDLTVRMIVPSVAAASTVSAVDAGVAQLGPTPATHLAQLKAIFRELPTVPASLATLAERLGDDIEYPAFVARHPLPLAPVRAGERADAQPRLASVHTQVLAAGLALLHRVGRRAAGDAVGRTAWRAIVHVAGLVAWTGNGGHAELLHAEWRHHARLPELALARAALRGRRDDATPAVAPPEALLL
jgi:hypothetical protein